MAGAVDDSTIDIVVASWRLRQILFLFEVRYYVIFRIISENFLIVL